jgi:hypothetical protein
MAIKITVFRITGTSPLMQSNPANFITDEVKKDLKAKKVEYDSQEEARLRVYENDGHFVHPSASFRRSMMNAVTGRKFGKKAARMVIAGAVFPCEEFVTILNGKGKPAKNYEIDKRSVVIKASKARVLRCRPKFWPWACGLPLEIDEELISPDQVKESLDLAGRVIGVGEFRPDPSDGKSGIGTFGRFTSEIK